MVRATAASAAKAPLTAFEDEAGPLGAELVTMNEGVWHDAHKFD